MPAGSIIPALSQTRGVVVASGIEPPQTLGVNGTLAPSDAQVSGDRIKSGLVCLSSGKNGVLAFDNCHYAGSIR